MKLRQLFKKQKLMMMKEVQLIFLIIKVKKNQKRKNLKYHRITNLKFKKMKIINKNLLKNKKLLIRQTKENLKINNLRKNINLKINYYFKETNQTVIVTI